MFPFLEILKSGSDPPRKKILKLSYKKLIKLKKREVEEFEQT